MASSNLPLASIHDRLGEEAWLQLWKDDNTPWDYGTAAPPLLDLLEEGDSLVPKTGSFLIPGCGSCHESFALFQDSPARKIIGLDLSSIPVEKSKAKRDSLNISPESIDFICGDFFKMTTLGSFDVIFDYTFLCALRPERRSDWARRMAELCKTGTGRLITLMFPLSEHAGGPPFALSVEM